MSLLTDIQQNRFSEIFPNFQENRHEGVDYVFLLYHVHVQRESALDFLNGKGTKQTFETDAISEI